MRSGERQPRQDDTTTEEETRRSCKRAGEDTLSILIDCCGMTRKVNDLASASAQAAE
jgi:hypothetical protein